MEEKDFKGEELRRRIFDARMKLALLGTKEGNPVYDEQIVAARAELVQARRELAKYKSIKLTERKEMKRW